MFAMLNCFSGKSSTLGRFARFVDEQQKEMDTLFVFLELERLFLQFFLNQIEHVVLELPTRALLRFLHDFRQFMLYYYDRGYYLEHIQSDFAQRNETFCDEHLTKKTFQELSDQFELWCFLLEISLRIGKSNSNPQRACLAEEIRNLIACQVNSLVFVHWVLNLSSIEQLFQQVDDRVIAAEPFYRQIIRSHKDVKGLGDIFNLKILGHLVKVFDIYGNDANYFLEAMAVVEKENINRKFDYCRERGGQLESAREEPGMLSFNILNLISEIAGKMQNKNKLVHFISKRIKAGYEKKGNMADWFDTNKNIVNGVIAKQLSLAELSRVACAVFEMGSRRVKLRSLKNDLIRNLEKAMESRMSISETLKDSFIDKRLRTNPFQVSDIRDYVDRVIKAKSGRQSQISLEEFSKICSSVLKTESESAEDEDEQGGKRVTGRFQQSAQHVRLAGVANEHRNRPVRARVGRQRKSGPIR